MTVEPTAGDYYDERNVLITAEGRRQARRQLEEAAARRTPAERRDQAQKTLATIRRRGLGGGLLGHAA